MGTEAGKHGLHGSLFALLNLRLWQFELCGALCLPSVPVSQNVGHIYHKVRDMIQGVLAVLRALAGLISEVNMRLHAHTIWCAWHKVSLLCE